MRFRGFIGRAWALLTERAAHQMQTSAFKHFYGEENKTQAGLEEPVSQQQRGGKCHSQTGNPRPIEAKIKPARVRGERGEFVGSQTTGFPQPCTQELPTIPRQQSELSQGNGAAPGTPGDKAPCNKRDLHRCELGGAISI